jgi:multidrug efflux pump subunit AcrB
MGINKFVYFLLVCSILVIFYEKDAKVIVTDNQEKPEISFYNSTAYDITTEGVSAIIKSNEAYLYKTREELVDGTVISKGDTNNSANIVSGDHFTKIEDQLYIDGNVNLQLENNIDIVTEQLEYNLKTKIANNRLPFEGTQYNHTFKGINLYVDMVNKYIKADNTKMKIEVINE